MPESVRQKRKSRAVRLYRKLAMSDVKKTIFTDEKDFTIEVPNNTQNNRVYGTGKKMEIPAERLYH